MLAKRHLQRNTYLERPLCNGRKLQCNFPSHDTGDTDFYTGLREPSWKSQWANHKENLKLTQKSNSTAPCIAKHIRKLNYIYIYNITFLFSCSTGLNKIGYVV